MKNFNIRYFFICALFIVLVGVIMKKYNGKTIPDGEPEFESFEVKMAQVDLGSDDSKMAYAFGLSQSTGLKEYISNEFGIDTLQLTKFEQGVYEGFSKGKDPHKRALYAGIQIGNQISDKMIYGINHEVFGDDSTKTISLKKFMAGFISATLGTGSLMSIDSATQMAQELMSSVKKKNMIPEFGSNKKQGEQFLADNINKDGVKVLPSGVQYKVLKKGSGAIPTETSLVTVHYEGKTLDGNVFDSSYKNGQPVSLRPNQTIKGFTDALVHMPAGSIWEVYIPQELAYGERQQGEIKPFSVLIFKIELLEVK